MNERVGFGLPLWIGVCVVLFANAPEPPAAKPPTADELAAMQREADFVVREARAWQRDHGDRAWPRHLAHGQLAIVIDDVGREIHLLERFIALRYRLTFSVLPGSVYATGAQLRLQADRRRYREVLLHLPMEPKVAAKMFEGPNASESFLRVDDDGRSLRAKTLAALDAVPSAVGVNNHMGSRLTGERRAMDAVASALRERGVFWLDSRTHHQTVAVEAMQAAGMRALSRTVFLDNDLDRSAIRARLLEAAERSEQSPDLPVVAIGHPSAELLEVLRAELPRVFARQINIVPVSHLLRERDEN